MLRSEPRPSGSVLHYLQNQALQVERFGDGEQDGVILALRAALQDAEGAVGVQAGLRNQLEERALAQMMRAGAGHQDAALWQRAQVDLLVSGGGGFQIAPALGEGWRIQHDGSEVASRAGIVG